MTTHIQKKAALKARRIKRLRQDPRFKRVIGKFAYEGWLETNLKHLDPRKVFIEDALWVGENLEPRVLEILPAALNRKPSVFLGEAPRELVEATQNLRKKNLKQNFKGIPLKKIAFWEPFIGRKENVASISKVFRFTPEEAELLNRLSQQSGKTETAVLKEALRSFARRSFS